MLKKFLLTGSSLAVAAYLFAALKLFVPFYLAWMTLAYTCMTAVIVSIWWIYIPQVKKNRSKTTILLIAIGSLMLTLLGKGAIEQHYMINSPFQIRIAAKIILLIVAIVLGGNLIKKNRLKTTHTCLTLCVILILLSPLYGAFSNGNDQKENASLTTDQLTTLPYVGRVPVNNSEQNGVTKYLQKKAYPGYNLYASSDSDSYNLMDMNGKIVNRWPAKNEKLPWHDAARLTANGDLVSIGYKRALTRQNWNGKIKWVNDKVNVHHDLSIAENGDIYTLQGKTTVFLKSAVPIAGNTDCLLIVSPEGKIKKNIDLTKILTPFLNNNYLKVHKKLIRLSTLRDLMKNILVKGRIKIEGSVFDMFHNNTVSIVDRDIDGICKKGNVIICPRNLDLIAIMDIDTEKLVWTMKLEEYSRPHNPTLLDNGNILLFDNGPLRGYSRVIEIDPLEKKVVWQYQADPPEEFFSSHRGGCQRLPNGNTLITESTKGSVFEITQDGDIVWEFYNPDVVDQQRGTIQNMRRIIDPENYLHLNLLKN